MKCLRCGNDLPEQLNYVMDETKEKITPILEPDGRSSIITMSLFTGRVKRGRQCANCSLVHFEEAEDGRGL